jgi:hypothetical protein
VHSGTPTDRLKISVRVSVIFNELERKQLQALFAPAVF